MRDFVEQILVNDLYDPYLKKLQGYQDRLRKRDYELESLTVDYNTISNDEFQARLLHVTKASVSHCPWHAEWQGTIPERNHLVHTQLFRQTQKELYVYTDKLENCPWPDLDEAAAYKLRTLHILCDEKPDLNSDLYDFLSNKVEIRNIFFPNSNNHITVATDESRHVLKYSFKDKKPYHFTISDKINQFYDFNSDKSVIFASFGTPIGEQDDPHPIDAFKRAAELGECLVGPKPKKSFWSFS